MFRQVAGYLPLTNLVLETRRCERRNRTICVNCFRRSRGFIQDGQTSFGAVASSSRVQATAKSGRADAVLRREASSSSAPVSVLADDTSVEVLNTNAVSTEAPVRSFFPPTFLFQLEALGSDGRLDLTQKMPDTITRWVGSAFCSNLKLGFGLSGSTSITTFKPFFAQIQVPFSVKRGELLLLKVSVFNFLPSDLSVVVALTPSKHFSLDGESATSTVCVSASQPTVLTFPLLFVTIGKVDITVRVKTYGRACGKPTTVKASDALRRELLVKPEGFPQEEVNSAFVCISEDGPSPILEHVELRRLHTLVPDSGRVWINVVGDLLAPSAANLRRLVRVPTGCGEQNMLGFVPNILVRRYLEAVKLLTGTLKTETTNNMVTGYQRELRYRHADGSYAAFQSSREGSLWLTAYVVRSYVAASRYIAIDSADLDVSTAWLLRHQKSDGSFPRVGRLFHREMRGGVEFGGTEALTAFVVLTLLEASGHQPAVDRALGFIGGTKTYSTLYTEVLVAHAFVQAGRTEGAQRVAALLSRGVRQGGQLHWEGDRSSKVGGSKAVDVEMTSYMVLSLLKLGGTQNVAEAALAIKWVNGRRNANGGFVSTQDTVVALTALTEFAIATYSPKASVKVQTTATGGFSYTVLVTPSTRLLTHKKKLLPLVLPGTVRFAVSGVGCALVQSVFRYTTTTPFPDPSFRLTATIIKSRCTSFSLRICTSFSRPNAESNMAIVEIEMLSGYVTVDRTLKTLKKNGVIERWEYSEGKAVLYFSEFTTKTVCFEVRLLQDIEVEKLKPAIVRVFDYYAVEDRFEVEYGPPDCEGKKG